MPALSRLLQLKTHDDASHEAMEPVPDIGWVCTKPNHPVVRIELLLMPDNAMTGTVQVRQGTSPTRALHLAEDLLKRGNMAILIDLTQKAQAEAGWN